MLKELLADPRMYVLFQGVLGGPRSRRLCIKEYLDIPDGARVLDIGCGPAIIAKLLKRATYVGYDIDERYIRYAQKKYSSLGTFVCAVYDKNERKKYEPFDFVLMGGLLHHLDDATGLKLLQLASDSLKAGGQVLAIDGCYHSKQSSLARYIVSSDRGQFIRTPQEYKSLGEKVFGAEQVSGEIRDNLLNIPYSLFVMLLKKADKTR